MLYEFTQVDYLPCTSESNLLLVLKFGFEQLSSAPTNSELAGPSRRYSPSRLAYTPLDFYLDDDDGEAHPRAPQAQGLRLCGVRLSPRGVGPFHYSELTSYNI